MLVVGKVRAFGGTQGPRLCVCVWWGGGRMGYCVHVGGGHREGLQRDPGSLFVCVCVGGGGGGGLCSCWWWAW